MIVRGEGEQTFLNLIKCLEKGEDISHVKGLAYRSSDEVLTTPAPPLVDVNKLPLPACHLLPMRKYHFTVLGKFTTILASRGCLYKCTFCSEWRFWGACWRPRKPKDIVEEMELLHKKYGRRIFLVWR